MAHAPIGKAPNFISKTMLLRGSYAPTPWFLTSLGSTSDPERGTTWSFMEVWESHCEEADLKSNGSKVFFVICLNLFTQKCFYRHPETPMPIVGWLLCNPYRIHVWFIWSHVPSFAINSAMDHDGIAYPWTQALFFRSCWDFLLVLSKFKWIFSPPI